MGISISSNLVPGSWATTSNSLPKSTCSAPSPPVPMGICPWRPGDRKLETHWRYAAHLASKSTASSRSCSKAGTPHWCRRIRGPMGCGWRRPRYLVRPFRAMGVPRPRHSRAGEYRHGALEASQGHEIRTLNFSPCVEGRRWWPWVREGLEETRVWAGDAPCHGEESRRASARRDARPRLLQCARRSAGGSPARKTRKGDSLMVHRRRAGGSLTADVSTRDCRPDAAYVPELRRCSTADHDTWALIVRLLLGGQAGMHLVRRGTADTRQYRAHAPEQAMPDDGGGRRRGPHCGCTVLRPGCLSPPRTKAAACIASAHQLVRRYRPYAQGDDL